MRHSAYPSNTGEDPSLFKAAKHELAVGRKDAGLRLLFALRHDLPQAPTEHGDIQQLKKHLEDTIGRWGAGFDWD